MTWIIHSWKSSIHFIKSYVSVLSNYGYLRVRLFLTIFKGRINSREWAAKVTTWCATCLRLHHHSAWQLASATIEAITLYDNSLFWPPGFDHPDCPAPSFIIDCCDHLERFSIASWLIRILLASPPYAIFQQKCSIAMCYSKGRKYSGVRLKRSEIGQFWGFWALWQTTEQPPDPSTA